MDKNLDWIYVEFNYSSNLPMEPDLVWVISTFNSTFIIGKLGLDVLAIIKLEI